MPKARRTILTFRKRSCVLCYHPMLHANFEKWQNYTCSTEVSHQKHMPNPCFELNFTEIINFYHPHQNEAPIEHISNMLSPQHGES